MPFGLILVAKDLAATLRCSQRRAQKLMQAGKIASWQSCPKGAWRTTQHHLNAYLRRKLSEPEPTETPSAIGLGAKVENRREPDRIRVVLAPKPRSAKVDSFCGNKNLT